MRLLVLALALYSAADSVRADAPWDPLEVVLTVKELAPGVYAVLPHDAFTRDHVATMADIVLASWGRSGQLLLAD